MLWGIHTVNIYATYVLDILYTLQRMYFHKLAYHKHSVKLYYKSYVADIVNCTYKPIPWGYVIILLLADSAE
jgi:hypothetical protein